MVFPSDSKEILLQNRGFFHVKPRNPATSAAISGAPAAAARGRGPMVRVKEEPEGHKVLRRVWVKDAKSAKVERKWPLGEKGSGVELSFFFVWFCLVVKRAWFCLLHYSPFFGGKKVDSGGRLVNGFCFGFLMEGVGLGDFLVALSIT